MCKNVICSYVACVTKVTNRTSVTKVTNCTRVMKVTSVTTVACVTNVVVRHISMRKVAVAPDLNGYKDVCAHVSINGSVPQPKRDVIISTSAVQMTMAS